MVQIPVERVEALLLWSDPYATAKVFGGGLYVLICLRHLVCGAFPAHAYISTSSHSHHRMCVVSSYGS